MEYTLASAAQATGIAKTTIFRAIKSGKLSARRLDDRTFRIDASELMRVYPIVAAQRSEETSRNVPQQEKNPATPCTSETEVAVLKAKLEMTEAQLVRERDTVEDLRRRLDDEQAERRSLQRQLTPPASGKPQDTPLATPGVEDLRKRLEQAEEHILALSTRPARPAVEQPREPHDSASVGSQPLKPTPSFLSRLIGRA